MAQVNIFTTENSKGEYESEAQLCGDNGRTSKLTQKKVPDVGAIKALQEYFPRIDSGLLPVGLRWVSPDRRIIAFEQPPRYITVSYTNAELQQIEANKANPKKTLVQKQVMLPMPWLFYVAYLSPQAAPLTIYMFAAQSQMMSLNHPLYSMPLMNFNTDGKLCRAAADTNELGLPATLEGAMAATFYGIWMTGFNNDLAGTLVSAAKHGTPAFLTKYAASTESILKGWAQQSMETVIHAKFPACPNNKSFKQLLDSKAVTADYAVDTGQYFTSRISAAFQNLA